MLQILSMTEAKLATLTPERLRELLSYDAATGVFRWRAKRGNRAAGAVAGCLHKRDGRVYIHVDGRLYKAHRLAWLYVHGVWPGAGLDHRDGEPAHNAINNLRPASQAENMQNLQRAHRDSRSGFLGVQRRRSGGWFGCLRSRGMRVVSKTSPTPAEAHAAYIEIKALFHPFSTLAA